MRDEFMTLHEAAEALGVSRATIWRRVQKGEIIAFQSHQDRRQRLVRREDIEAMMRPVEVDPGKELAAA